ncbi:TonB-dependent receptor [Sphingomonas sp. DBB INV C78]|uniref:TonB-dependent receptor n=1 Tax=Sphingomonas sp. DBB INV C78 TaxID=3349434 RepID=UPI0036D31629
MRIQAFEGTAMALLLGFAGSPAVHAQNVKATGVDDQLETITVTARRQSEALQTTPVAVTAFSSRLLDHLNVQQVTAIAELTPNLQILPQSTGATAATISIRGISQQEPAVTAEAGVGIYLDGVYIARTAGSVFDLVDLARIEVLRGPQGTLFGRNTTGGAIQLISREPDDTIGAQVKAGYGSFDEWYARARFDTGLIDDSGLKASFAYLHRQRDGYVNNLLAPSSEDPGALNSDTLSVAVSAQASETFRIRYNFDYSKRFAVADFFQLVAATPDVLAYFGASPSYGGASFTVAPGRRETGEQVDYHGNFGAVSESWGNALTIDWQATSDVAVKSITAYREFSQNSTQTLSGNGRLLGLVVDASNPAGVSVQPVVPFNGFNRVKQHQVSQEFQLFGNSRQFSYVAGAFYFRENGSEALQQELTLVLPGGGLGVNLPPFQGFDGTSTSYALFGQVSYRPDALDNKLELTGGLRQTWDKKRITLDSSIFGAPTATGTGRRDFSNLSWTAAANYRFTGDVMAYAKASSGFKAGGFSPRASVIAPFEPEEAVAFEVGLKSELLDRRLRLNLAAFRTDYDNLQIQQFAAGSSGASSLIVNAGKVVFQGFEAEVAAVPVRGLTLSAALGYTDPNYKSFLYRDPATDQIIDVADEARMPQAAKCNWTMGAEYKWEVGDIGELTLRADYSWRGRIYFFALDRQAPFNREISSPEVRDLRARLTLSDVILGTGRTRLEASLWGANLTNAHNLGFGVDFGSLGFGGVTYLPPRSAGIDVKLTY